MKDASKASKEEQGDQKDALAHHVKGYDIRIPAMNDDDFDKRIEWQLDMPRDLQHGETRMPTYIFYRETDVRCFLCNYVLTLPLEETTRFSFMIRRVERFVPKAKGSSEEEARRTDER
jgi:hypothetical protein